MRSQVRSGQVRSGAGITGEAELRDVSELRGDVRDVFRIVPQDLGN